MTTENPTQISIEWISGRPDDGGAKDESRAEDAARAVFDKAGIDPMDAQAVYRDQWEEFDDEKPMTGLALIWVDATKAANVALTSTWEIKNRAECSIEAWKAK